MNTVWQHDLATSHARMGAAMLGQDDREGARAAYDAAQATFERLAQLDPANAQWQAVLALASSNLALTLPPAEAADARALLVRALRILRPLAAANRLTHEQKQWLPKIEAQLAALPAVPPRPPSS